MKVSDILKVMECGERIVIKNKQWRTLFDFDGKEDVPLLVQDMDVTRISAVDYCMEIIV